MLYINIDEKKGDCMEVNNLVIDMEKTGFLLKLYSMKYGYSVKDIQTYIGLSCPQPVYRWFKGKILPSVENLLKLSELYNVHMEELIVKKAEDSAHNRGCHYLYTRLYAYVEKLV